MQQLLLEHTIEQNSENTISSFIEEELPDHTTIAKHLTLYQRLPPLWQRYGTELGILEQGITQYTRFMPSLRSLIFAIPKDELETSLEIARTLVQEFFMSCTTLSISTKSISSLCTQRKQIIREKLYAYDAESAGRYDELCDLYARSQHEQLKSFNPIAQRNADLILEQYSHAFELFTQIEKQHREQETLYTELERLHRMYRMIHIHSEQLQYPSQQSKRLLNEITGFCLTLPQKPEPLQNMRTYFQEQDHHRTFSTSKRLDECIVLLRSFYQSTKHCIESPPNLDHPPEAKP